ncbi:hypothetical protein FHR24_002102 [Wenyingzhuangia heitensis]|uniref:MoaF-like domain-containing protein n=1 Tax=Wenyingzhuangia heitensis TaxID=1487859 RepID=A0ABX0U9Y7_9FLAO|nr:hypothetical protein [Wenyingzhuangia heitensis]NIJ45634.1 hypothetical protein [Wenyingzhuangia heitensis]
MKTKIITFICAFLFSIGISVAQNKKAEDYKFNFNEPEHFIDGYSLNYQYQNGTAIHMEFKDGKASYEWINRPRKGHGNKDIPYRSSKLGNNIYLVNWHETEIKDYLTIVFDFNKMTIHSSIIVGYENKPNRKLRTVFKSGIIDHLTLSK